MVEQDFDNPRIWEEPKPFLRDFYVPFSVYDETFHTRKLTKDPAPLDPCCTSCREPGDVISLCVYVPDESYLPTWEFIQSNLEAIESALKVKLAAIHARCLVGHHEENLPGMPVWQKHWEFIQSELGGEPAEQLNRFFKLTGISIVRSEPEYEWIVGYNFQTAWDMDHGIEIIMWNEKVLAAGGMLELTSTGGSPMAGAKATQEYEFDPGDYRLP